jgi:16S rRNA processing protein RimM
MNMALQESGGPRVPADLVQVGYVSGAYGLQGWVRVTAFSSTADALLNAKVWWIDKPELHDVDVMQAKMHSGDVVVQLMGIAGRDAAEALKGAAIQIQRSHFPALSDGEFYWVDLIGLAVVNLQGESVGTVHDMMDNGAHPILRVLPPVVTTAEQSLAAEILIPFVDQFVKTVDQQERKIVVDWGLDY